MRPPKTVRIGSSDFDIVTVKEIDGGNSIGMFYRDAKRIEMVKQSPDIDANTLLHEVMHGLMGESGLDQTPWGRKNEEQIVTALTNQLMQLFLNNPNLPKYLAWAVKQP